MLQLRVAKVWMLADGQGRCSEHCGLHQGML